MLYKEWVDNDGGGVGVDAPCADDDDDDDDVDLFFVVLKRGNDTLCSLKRMWPKKLEGNKGSVVCEVESVEDAVEGEDDTRESGERAEMRCRIVWLTLLWLLLLLLLLLPLLDLKLDVAGRLVL